RSHRNSNGNYQFLGIAYSQYAKLDFDFTKSVILNDRNSLAFHAAFGIGIPYGNSTILPYEKRYFAGGANSIRGW
ncbi:BamA/TamA family outer membrane protein, partial [Acinetobacter sp. 163]|nr:BamA/TamA family outer membrane protein [Acinetobacter sp. 163]